jgi:hypothetical protein
VSLRTILISLALAAAAFPAAAAPADDEAAIVSAEKALHDHFDGFALDDSAGAPALMEASFAAVRRWAANYLTAHPATSAAAFSDAILKVAGDASVVGLGGGAFLIAQPDGEAGQVFIVAPGPGGAQTAWTAAQAGQAAGPTSMLRAWIAASAQDSCRDKVAQTAWMTCGPLRADIARLPDRADGKARFFVDATYSQRAGATMGAQISLWTWDGHTASLDLVGPYEWEVDQPVRTHLEGSLLTIHEKGTFKTFFSCGSCEGRQLVWSFKLGPAGVQDLGKRSLEPDLDLVDALIDRAVRKAPAGDIASPAAAAVVGKAVEGIRHQFEPGDAHPLVGMLMGWNVRGPATHRIVCVAIDGLGQFDFAVAGMGQARRVATVTPLADDKQCPES